MTQTSFHNQHPGTLRLSAQTLRISMPDSRNPRPLAAFQTHQIVDSVPIS